jgi:hypothetical protein
MTQGANREMGVQTKRREFIMTSRKTEVNLSPPGYNNKPGRFCYSTKTAQDQCENIAMHRTDALYLGKISFVLS